MAPLAIELDGYQGQYGSWESKVKRVGTVVGLRVKAATPPRPNDDTAMIEVPEQ